MLTEQQVFFFETFGYLRLPGLLRDDMAWIIEEFEQVFPDSDLIAPHDGRQRTCVVPFIDQRKRLAALLDDRRIEGLCADLAGPDFNYMLSDGNYYVGDTNWHPDGRSFTYRHVKLAFYLDSLTRDTGALRVIPGSHRLGDTYANRLQEAVQHGATLWGVPGREVPCAVLETVPGDVVCFDHNLLHASFGGGNRRRMFTINICERYADEDLEELRAYIQGWARFWLDRAYGETMVATAGPNRMRHLEQVMANDHELAAHSAEERRRRPEPSRR